MYSRILKSPKFISNLFTNNRTNRKHADTTFLYNLNENRNHKSNFKKDSVSIIPIMISENHDMAIRAVIGKSF